MCGIAGLLTQNKTDYRQTLREMVGSILYRGPDEAGYYTDAGIGLGHARLAIIDPAGGSQPAMNEDGSVVVIFNGEIFNYRALREELLKKGHTLSNNSDTAVLPHLYEEHGYGMFRRLNGQFAVAVWDKEKRRLILGRDRFGEKPLFYYHRGGDFCFASEVKAIFKSGLLSAALSPAALKHIFTFWTTAGDESVFLDVRQVMPGSCLVFENGRLTASSWWHISFDAAAGPAPMDEEEYIEELDRLLAESVKNRMVADVPVSFYLSGGLDSSLVTCIAGQRCGAGLNTFSVTFDDEGFDESAYQKYLSETLGTNHRSVSFSRNRIPGLLREVIYHTEVPLLRSGAFPMYVLAGLVREDGMKVVLSGEGSDELFGGYDIFREVKIRDFCRRLPGSEIRPALYKRINSFVRGLNDQSAGTLSYFYNSPDAEDAFSSHLSRWKLGLYSLQFFSPEYQELMREDDALSGLRAYLPDGFASWTPVRRAQYLEMTTLFSNYLLSSQGDRVSMGQSVECRYPFLDYGVFDFAASLPDTLKIRGLNEKYIVKRLARRYVPELITQRKKFPYRAPIDISAMMKSEELRETVSHGRLQETGIFNPRAFERFLSSVLMKEAPNERDCMLFMGVVTTQILSDLFVGR
jgi:asparagine synthase (glutamine-hydrolysing)